MMRLGVVSVKRKDERDVSIQQIRNQHFPTKITKFEVNYYFIDTYQLLLR